MPSFNLSSPEFWTSILSILTAIVVALRQWQRVREKHANGKPVHISGNDEVVTRAEFEALFKQVQLHKTNHEDIVFSGTQGQLLEMVRVMRQNAELQSEKVISVEQRANLIEERNRLVKRVEGLEQANAELVQQNEGMATRFAESQLRTRRKTDTKRLIE